MENMNDDAELSKACFAEFLDLIHRLTGITIAENRKSMVQGRLRKRMRQLDISQYDSYLGYLKANSSEKPLFIDLVTTNETYFYRTPRIWEHITNNFLPRWHRDHGSQVFQAWSAASSSGEEAHTLGVLCREFQSSHPKFQYQILATDISQEMVTLSQRGQYSGRSIESFRQLQPKIFERHMRLEGQHYRVSPEIRDRLKFRTHNLFDRRPTQESSDLILLRNVLIYFTRDDQEKVLANLYPSLASDGLLVIGESESLTHITSNFEPVAPLIYVSKKIESKVLKESA